MALKFRVCVTQKCMLDCFHGYLFAFCRYRAPSAYFLFCTLLGNVRTPYRPALTAFAQVTHFVSPVTVEPLAVWLSRHFVQYFFVRLTKSRASVIQICIFNNYRGPASPYVYPCSMCRVAGGNCLSNNHCDRYRGNQQMSLA